MSVHILDAMAREAFEEVIAIHDRSSGLRGFLALHDTSVGPALGGIRRFAYSDEQAALLDCLRLARAMTHKCVLAGLPAGGAKLVFFDRQDLDLEAAYHHLGGLVERLGGRFFSGPDVGTGWRELDWVAARTSYCARSGAAGPGDLGGATAAGVFAGMAAALRQLDGEVDWPRRSVAIQGLGEVGAKLARRLVECGARVIAADVDSERAEAVARELPIALCESTALIETTCDIFAPCAMGGVLHDLSIKRLRARIVAGGANNQLAKALHGDRLADAGVLYVPDFLINSGALIRGGLFHLEQRREPLEAIEQRVGRNTAQILELAHELKLPPARVATERAEELLAQRRSKSVATKLR